MTKGKGTAQNPAATKKQCPDFEAGFLNVALKQDFAATGAAVEALTPDKSIFDASLAPDVLSGEEYQYVNFAAPDDDFLDTIPGSSIKFAADRMGMKPRILVRLKEEKAFKFKLELLAHPDNLKYYDNEDGTATAAAKHPDFVQDLGPKEYTANDKGYLIIDDLVLGAAAGNRYTLKVEVTEPGYEGVLIKEFQQGALRTARYIWMLPVVSDKNRWTANPGHSACMSPTILMYNRDAYLHINNTSLAEVISNGHECLNMTEMYANINPPTNPRSIIQQFRGFLNTVTRPPADIKKYIFVALMTRFFYMETISEARGKIPLDGNKHFIPVPNYAVMPFAPGDKSYLVRAEGTYRGAWLRNKTIDIKACTQAINGYDSNSATARNGHIGCSLFEVDTAGLPRSKLSKLKVAIEYRGMEAVPAVGLQWSAGGTPSGFLAFTTQEWDDATMRLSLRQHSDITIIASHELGHACQMTVGPAHTSGRPNAIPNFYDNADPILGTGPGGEGHQGPHCKIGFRAAVPGIPAVPASATIPGTPAVPGLPRVPGRCLMFGSIEGGGTFCSVTGTDKTTLLANKQNDCSMAIKKVSLYNPFRPFR